MNFKRYYPEEDTKMESYKLDTGLFKLLSHIKNIKALRMKLTDL